MVNSSVLNLLEPLLIFGVLKCNEMFMNMNPFPPYSCLVLDETVLAEILSVFSWGQISLITVFLSWFLSLSLFLLPLLLLWSSLWMRHWTFLELSFVSLNVTHFPSLAFSLCVGTHTLPQEGHRRFFSHSPCSFQSSLWKFSDSTYCRSSRSS